MSATSDLVTLQRTALCDLLDQLSDAQWDAETLCEGWDAGDVVAHLVVREREPVPAIGILFPPLSGLHDRRVAARKAAGRETLMRQLRGGPPPWMRLPFTGDVQVGEDWIHLQDIARGGAASAEGPAPASDDGGGNPEVAKRLWQAVGRFAPMTLRGIDSGGVVALTDGRTTKAYAVGGKVARPTNDPANLTITGPVGELLLFATGRTACEVTFDGDPALRTAIEGSRRAV